MENKEDKVAVRVGFEPTEPVKVQRFSRPPDSTALAPHRCFIILASEPAGHQHLLFGVEVDGVFAMGVEISEEGVLPAGEGEEGHWRGDSDVDSHHADFNPALVVARGLAILREDRGRVAELGTVHESDGVLQGVDADDGEHRSEDLFAGDGHAGLDVVEDSRAYEVAFAFGG